MRRIVSALLLSLICMPVAAFAAKGQVVPVHKKSFGSWRASTDKHLGVVLRYPGDWSVVRQSTGPGSGELSLVSSRANYAINAFALPFAASGSIDATLSHFIAYERSTTHSNVYNQTRWSSARLGGRPARVGIIKPPTEGGVAISDGIYLTQWRGRSIEVTIMAYRKPPASRLSQFPSIYFQILSTWRFV